MNKEKIHAELWHEYLELVDKYGEHMPCYEIGYMLIEFNVKMLMDMAPSHKIALETIKIATESGIKWHVEEKNKKEGI
jgi:hypothetical protein